ncbi:hypothetical protein GTY65_19535 [Streptomyces sp. SID8379]|uniref:hypothetical protein n=1 Tax=unclassified Streptomyces TaxID=2593676 RepID=UPI00037735BC|nr:MULTISPECIES: hypothetical protein [unclassified Streptomyces]MYW66228.1 hypothetical protein [Streptomyces sp. SID8379]
MGWAVLYVAFGLVALWLLGEVLLQYKARLRWRLLAFGGFLGVVLGVLMPSVYVIGAGAIAFAIGQTYVTLSFRRGFAAGWALKGGSVGENLGGSKRRKREPVQQDPTLEVSDLEYEQGAASDAYPPMPESAAETTSVYAPEPMPDDTGQYGVYSDAAYAQAAQGAQGYGYDTGTYGYDQNTYGYDTGQQPYAAPYSDPYIGAQSYPEQPQYGDPYATGQQQYGDPYATAAGYGSETPPGGVWVPQQRNGDEYGGELPPEQPYPTYPQHDPNNGYDTGYQQEQQYRY